MRFYYLITNTCSFLEDFIVTLQNKNQCPRGGLLVHCALLVTSSFAPRPLLVCGISFGGQRLENHHK